MPGKIDPQVAYKLANGGCFRCKRADNLIDTDCHITHEKGFLAFCRGCVADLASECDFALTENYAQRLEAAEKARDEALAKVAKLESALGEIADAFAAVGSKTTRKQTRD